MSTQPRHSIVPVRFINDDLDYFASRLEHRLASLAGDPARLVGAMQTDFFNALVYSITSNRSNDEVLHYLKLYGTLMLSNFRLGAGKVRFEADFDGRPISFEPCPKTDFMSVDHWKSAFDACMILRDMKGLELLATVPEQVFIGSNSGASSFDLAYFRFLSHFFTGGQDTPKWILDVLSEANKPQDNSVRQDFVDRIRYPELMLYKAFVLGEAEKFNHSLTEALEAHQKLFGSKASANKTTGWISLPILSACVMASDSKKFPIGVESDYIPRWLIMGEGIITKK
jgi:hypothetical protein